MSELAWKDPPERKGEDWARIAAQLRELPGEWAFVGDRSTTTAQQIKNGQLIAFRPAGSYEATRRNVEGSRCDLYIRYVGEAS